MQKEEMDTIRTIVEAMKVLDQAKDDYKCLFAAVFDEYEHGGGAMTAKELKAVSKAVLDVETSEAAESHQRIADALESIGASHD